MENKKAINVFRTNLTMSNRPHIPYISNHSAEKRILSVLRYMDTPLGGRSKYDLDKKFSKEYSYKYKELLEYLIKQDYISIPERYVQYHSSDIPIQTSFYKLKIKGELYIVNKWKKWFSDPDNKWKIIAMILTPSITFFLGYYLGKAFH
jgi:hypothetical protein